MHTHTHTRASSPKPKYHLDVFRCNTLSFLFLFLLIYLFLLLTSIIPTYHWYLTMTSFSHATMTDVWEKLKHFLGLTGCWFIQCRLLSQTDSTTLSMHIWETEIQIYYINSFRSWLCNPWHCSLPPSLSALHTLIFSMHTNTSKWWRWRRKMKEDVG